MSDFTPSPQQAAAIRAIVDWYTSPNRTAEVFRLFGYAGSGKSTITRYVIERLGLKPMDRRGGGGGVLFAAFTGKAALVMTRKGTPASTIHSLIYRVPYRPTPSPFTRAKARSTRLSSSPCLPSTTPCCNETCSTQA
jgi:exodeoxyribonuclease-5